MYVICFVSKYTSIQVYGHIYAHMPRWLMGYPSGGA